MKVKMREKYLLPGIILAMIWAILCAQGRKESISSRLEEYKIAFYNVENLFDTHDDPECEDDEFLPWGIKGWNRNRLNHKLQTTAKVIIGLGKWNPPAIVGLCEIENEAVLNMLITESPLASWPFAYVHFDSPDRRGIDVAMLYQREHFTVLNSDNIAVHLSFDSTLKTRDILYVKGLFCNRDTLHIFINHWPSRYGDYAFTSRKRMAASRILRENVDSLYHVCKDPKIVIMGDFNDEPDDESLRFLYENDTKLHNLMKDPGKTKLEGSIKYKSQWYVFDQILVSSNLLDPGGKICIPDRRVWIYHPDFLLMKDEKYFGIKPFRTYSGPRYIGGYSDHLPVFIKLKVGN